MFFETVLVPIDETYQWVIQCRRVDTDERVAVSLDQLAALPSQLVTVLEQIKQSFATKEVSMT